jgi:hypothetical protein
MDIPVVLQRLRPEERRVLSVLEVVEPRSMVVALRENADAVSVSIASPSDQHCPWS